MVSYLVRYNWAVVQGQIKPLDEYRGLAYEDMVIIELDDVEEMVLTLCKEYNMQYGYVMDSMYYSDVTVIYAKLANEKAFSTYNDFINLDEQSQGKYVTDFGKPKPFIYSILSLEKQRKNIEDKNGLRNMYRSGGRLNDWNY